MHTTVALPVVRARHVGAAVAVLLAASLSALGMHERAGGPTFVESDATFVEPARAFCDTRPAAERGAEALTRIRYPYAELNYDVRFGGPKRGYLAITFTGAARIEVYVRRCQTVDSIASILGHEFGHAVDHRYMTSDLRGEYLAARGITATWFGCNRCTDFATGAGDFAEVFGFFHSPPGPFRSRLGPAPNPSRKAEFSRFYFAPPLPTTTAVTPPTTAAGVVVTLLPRFPLFSHA